MCLQLRRSSFNTCVASTYGGAILANYSFPEDFVLPGFSIPIRFEYICEHRKHCEWRTQPALWPWQQCLVDHRDPDLSVQDLLRARRVLPRGTNSTTPALFPALAATAGTRHRRASCSKPAFCSELGRARSRAIGQRGHGVLRRWGALDVVAMPEGVEEQAPGGAGGSPTGGSGKQALHRIGAADFAHRA